ncbi:hypothetical protein [Nostoc sp. CMAA1605]|uniref:hypothetical protein n=1 Tax=Nostoc sp. CMAA1605 TaxID=2055159 RepID=UPI001F209823|nr:hypothetical protein [Nostoc sp. CMAA1605]
MLSFIHSSLVSRDWGLGTGDWGLGTLRQAQCFAGDWEIRETRKTRKTREILLQCPMPNAQCPMPNSQCPMPNAQCPMPNSLNNLINNCPHFPI